MGDYDDIFNRNQNAAVQARTKAQNRANVIQLKLIGQGHPTGLTNNLLKLFEARPPLEFRPPPEKRKCPPLSGMGQFVSRFTEPGDPEYAPPVVKGELPSQRRARIHELRLEKGTQKAAEEFLKYDPNNDPNASGDPYKTLFVARLSYETSESRLKREFESYGPVKRVRLVTDKKANKPRGYAFIEYMHTRDMKVAYKQGDGKKIDGRRVLVDVERGRTVPNWRPRRLGGGLGTTRVGGEDISQREQLPSGPSRSEEPRTREDRGDRDVERSRERRDRDREPEKSRERSHDRSRDRDRDHKEDKHHRERDKDKDKDREHGRDRERGRDRARNRDRGRDRDRDHERDRGRDHDRTRDKEDRDYDDPDHKRGHSRGKSFDRVESKHDYRDYDHGEPHEQPEHGHRRSADQDRYEHRDREQYDPMDVHGDDDDRYDQYADQDQDRYHQMEENDYRYGSAPTESRRKDHDSKRSERSVSREYNDH